MTTAPKFILPGAVLAALKIALACVFAAIAGHFVLADRAEALGTKIKQAASDCVMAAAPIGYETTGSSVANLRDFGDAVATRDGIEFARLQYPYSVQQEREFIKKVGGSGVAISRGFARAGIVISLDPVDGFQAFLLTHYHDRVTASAGF